MLSRTALPPRSPLPLHTPRRSVWSMTKDPDLELALSRNRRWTVNNQIRQFLLRFPSRSAPLPSLQRRLKALGVRVSAAAWLRKYPSCFSTSTSTSPSVPLVSLSKPLAALSLDESLLLQSQLPHLADRLARLLMLARDRRLPLLKLSLLRRSLGLPDDFLLRFSHAFPARFRVLDPSARRNSLEIHLPDPEPCLAVSSLEASSAPGPPRFLFSLPDTWARTRERFDEFNDGSPYVSPYAAAEVESEKREVAMVHELLSLTLWKRASVSKLAMFAREFGLPKRLDRLLMRHPGVFYVSNRYKVHTVVLREAYRGSELVEKDPLVVMKERFGELMQEGVWEYNRRRREANLEKRRKSSCEVEGRIRKEEEGVEEEEEEEERRDVLNGEERRRFYKVLFDENMP